MFKQSYWIILFLIIALMLYIPFEYDVLLTETMEDESLRLESYCISAAQAALSVAELDEESVFGNEQIREYAIDTFFTVYCDCCNYTSETEIRGAKDRVPCVFLVDNDGYYVYYTQEYTATGDVLECEIMTEKNTWAEAYGDFVVRYQLNDVLTISDFNEKEETRYVGTYERVKSLLEKKYGKIPKELEFLSDEQTYVQEKNSVIVYAIDRGAEYYINAHNEMYNTKETEYELSLSTLSDGNVSSLLDSPSVIAFIQGAQTQGQNTYINIYTYGASDVVEEPTYYITERDGEYYYHTAECIKDEEYMFEGTALECAKEGANPDDCVYNK